MVVASIVAAVVVAAVVVAVVVAAVVIAHLLNEVGLYRDFTITHLEVEFLIKIVLIQRPNCSLQTINLTIK